MARKIQHIVDLGEAKAGVYDMRKVTALCGAKEWPLIGVGNHIPTCSDCVDVVLGGAS